MCSSSLLSSPPGTSELGLEETADQPAQISQFSSHWPRSDDPGPAAPEGPWLLGTPDSLIPQTNKPQDVTESEPHPSETHAERFSLYR